MAYELPSLPYDYTALEPAISQSTLEFHHDKHHAGYVSKYNNAVKGTELDSKSIEEVIKAMQRVGRVPRLEATASRSDRWR